MRHIAIRVEGLSKLYRIGARQRYRTLREALTDTVTAPIRWFHDSGSSNRPRNSEKETIWALKDASFEVRQGEVIGIIGRNGAGKSTLLKILSRITKPTNGHAEIHGRVGSLLEVGTGFHSELTGRENIYLNGAILGMRRAEINRQFDEIVSFADVDAFIDTPVKHYSSGMYLRLAFAVAAHLNPEILLVDEVLAVGDVSFQRKCLGKMSEVAREGRTVLFVSHNLGAIRNLCTRALMFQAGRLQLDGPPDSTVRAYLTLQSPPVLKRDSFIAAANDLVIQDVQLLDSEGCSKDSFEAQKTVTVEITYRILSFLRDMRLSIWLLTDEGDLVFVATDHSYRNDIDNPGVYKACCIIPGSLLNRRNYSIEVAVDVPGISGIIPRTNCASFSVVGVGNQSSHFAEPWPGVICPVIEWEHRRIEV